MNECDKNLLKFVKLFKSINFNKNIEFFTSFSLLEEFSKKIQFINMKIRALFFKINVDNFLLRSHNNLIN